MKIDYDTSIEILCAMVDQTPELGSTANGVIIRDTSGHLTFVADVARDNVKNADEIEVLFGTHLKAYAARPICIRFNDDPGASRILTAKSKLPITREDGSICWLLDRRVVGSGWLATPSECAAAPPRIVFASLKGGVGRSTALAITAFDLAQRGFNVLTVDLDLEAPGLGELLLSETDQPQYGVVDYLVEDGIGHNLFDSNELYVARSSLSSREGGQVDVVPALGKSSKLHPQHVLGKLARAMTDSHDAQGDLVTPGMRIERMINQIVSARSYDVVLIDSRAGLAELTAPAILGLGAHILLFGTAQKQTISGYKPLFANFQTLAIRDVTQGGNAQWRRRLKPVLAKATVGSASDKWYREELYELFASCIYDEDGEYLPDDERFNYSPADESAPHAPLTVPFNPTFAEFDPARNAESTVRPFYEQTFREFLRGIDTLIGL